VKAIGLCGRDHGDVGSVGEVAAERLAVVISRGGAEKRYEYTDPNEDVALAATGRYGALVAVADGHWGMRAAEVAIAHLRDAHAENWLDAEARSAESWYQDVLHGSSFQGRCGSSECVVSTSGTPCRCLARQPPKCVYQV
jgi:hypothetical protein